MREYIHYFLSFFFFFFFFWDILYLVSPNVSFITISGRPPHVPDNFGYLLSLSPLLKTPGLMRI